MKKINILLSSSIAVLLLSSCNPILDREMILTMTEKQALESYDVAQKRVNGLYTYLPNGFSPVGGAMMAAASWSGRRRGALPLPMKPSIR